MRGKVKILALQILKLDKIDILDKNMCGKNSIVKPVLLLCGMFLIFTACPSTPTPGEAIAAQDDLAALTQLERSRLDAVRAEHDLTRQGLMDTDAAIDVGRLLGAQYRITGQVIPMSAQAIIFARVIHVQTGEIVSAAQVFVENAILGDLL